MNPTLPEVEEHKELDLIVVDTPDALTMVEAGANQVSEEKLLEALDPAHDEIRKLCDAQSISSVRPARRSGSTTA